MIHIRNFWDKKYIDFVFEGKNREYGAYDARRRYPRNVLLGFVYSILFLLLLLYAQDIIEWIKSGKIYDTNYQVVVINNLPPPPEIITPQYYSPPIEKHDVHLLPKITQDSVAEPEPVKKKVDKVVLTKDTAGTTKKDTGSSTGTTNNTKDNGDAGLFMRVDKLPEFPGGKDALRQFIQQNIQYPREEKIKNRQGTVRVKCIVEEDGSLTSIAISTGLTTELNKEAVRLVKLMPPWRPAFVNNRPHRIWMIIPITFAIRK